MRLLFTSCTALLASAWQRTPINLAQPLVAGSAAASPGPGCRLATVLNLPSCDGLLDSGTKHGQYAVHSWLLKALAAPVRPGAAVLVNASFTFPHPLRPGCYSALRRHADAHPNVTFLAVSFHTSDFLPNSAVGRHAGPSPSNVKWIVMEPTGGKTGSILPMPYVVDRHKWPAQTLRPTPWEQRKLLFFAGHVSKPGWWIPTGSVRRALVVALKNETRATVSAQFLAHVEANQSSPRLTIQQYVRAAHEHRFCLVSPGDTPSTRKLAETMVLAAEGACLPLVIARTFLPYVDELNYTAVVTSAPLPRSREAASRLLDRLEQVDRHEARARIEAARGMRRAFLQPRAALFALRRFGAVSTHHHCPSTGGKTGQYTLDV